MIVSRSLNFFGCKAFFSSLCCITEVLLVKNFSGHYIDFSDSGGRSLLGFMVLGSGATLTLRTSHYDAVFARLGW